MISKKDILFAVLLLVGGFFILLALLPNGIQLSGDTASYYQMASHFTDTGKIPTSPLYSPGYPVLLGLFSKITGCPLTHAFQYYAALLYGLNAMLVFLTGLLFIRDRLKAFLLAGLFLLSSHVTALHLKGMTESTFLFFLLLFFCSVYLYISKQKTWYLLATIFSVALLSLVKYTGLVAFVLGFALVIIYTGTKKKKLLNGLLFAILCLVPYVLWIKYNAGSSKLNPSAWSHTGLKEYIDTFVQNVHDAGSCILSWFLPARLSSSSLVIYPFAGLVLLVLAFFFFRFVFPLKGFSTRFKNLLEKKEYVVLGSFCILYFGAIFMLQLLIMLNEMDNRVLLWIYVPLLIMLVRSVSLRPLKREPMNLAGVGLLVLIVIILSGRTYVWSKSWRTEPEKYPSILTLEKSETLNYINTHFNEYKGARIVSNFRDGLLMQNRITARPSALGQVIKGNNISLLPDEKAKPLISAYKDSVTLGQLRMVLFNHNMTKHEQSLINNLKAAEKTKIIIFKDGIILESK